MAAACIKSRLPSGPDCHSCLAPGSSLTKIEPAAGSNPRVLQAPGPAPFVTGLGLPPGGENLAKGTPCRNKLTGRKTPTPQSVLRSSLTTGSTRSGPGGGASRPRIQERAQKRGAGVEPASATW